MAFNPLSTFHKNKRFWMAAVLMICMITFVFCTGTQGGIDDLIKRLMGNRGTAVVSINGRRYAHPDLDNLRRQRNLANDYMIRSSDYAFRKLTAAMMEFSKKIGDEKDAEKRKQELTKLAHFQMALAERKSRPRYFDGGIKLDDLVEFKLWQLQADRLGIYLDEATVTMLYNDELFVRYFYAIQAHQLTLDPQDRMRIQMETVRNFAGGGVSDAYIRRAIGEEFRVRMAQEAILTSQPSSYYTRGRQQNQPYTPKTAFPELPDEVRAPMTLLQLLDVFKAKRATFEATLIPIHVADYAKDVKDPTGVARQDFFDAHKNKPYDPASPDWGLEIPQNVKLEYVMADPTSPAYKEMAKFKLAFDVLSPFAVSPLQGPTATAAHFAVNARAQRDYLERRYAEMNRRQAYDLAAPYGAADFMTPLIAWFAKDDPQAIASMIGRSFLTPTDPFGAVSTYLAVGASKHKTELAAAAQAEIKRRAPLDAALFAASTSPNPLNLAAPFLAMDRWMPHPMAPAFEMYRDPPLPLEVVQKEIEDSLVRDIARDWALANIRTVRKALDKAQGSQAHFKRDLDRLVPEFKLTFGPANKDKWYSRYSVDTAKSLQPLKEAFDKSMHLINFAEGRDLTPDSLLKPGDFWKMFFDGTEEFAATTKWRAMPWPPRVKTNSSRAFRMDVDPTLINREQLEKENPEGLRKFMGHLSEQDPNKPAQEFEGLFQSAEKPILFWRTAEIAPYRPSDYSKLEKDLHKYAAELKKIDAERKNEKDQAKLEKLKEEALQVEKTLADLKEVNDRITEGWKLQEARQSLALPAAKNLAQEFVKTNDISILTREAERLKKLGKAHRSLVILPNLSLMQPQPMGIKIDYGPTQLPKDTFEYPRQDLMAQIVSLYDMQKPIKIDYKDLDDINRELFETAKKEKKASNFVQILTNKPRTVYYVALISRPPFASNEEFVATMQAASGRQGRVDFFATRVQQQQAREFRQGIVDDMKRAASYEGPTDEARKSFDERGGD